MTFFGLKSGQDLENRAAHPHQELPGVRPLRGSGAGCKSCHHNHRIEYNAGCFISVIIHV